MQSFHQAKLDLAWDGQLNAGFSYTQHEMVKNVSMTRKEFLTARKQVFREVHGLQS